MSEWSRVFDLDLQLLQDAVLMMIAIFVLFLAASYFLFNPVRSMLEKRKNKIKDELDEASNMANGSISAVQEAINQLSGMLDGTIDVNPTITPTLDLSEVNAKSAALANMFNGRQVAVQAQADEQQTAMMNQLGNILAEQNAEPKSVVFNQTNNSPKALSTGEIYRQTRNGFSRLVSAVT